MKQNVNFKGVFLYHGSDTKVELPSIEKCSNHRDFGRSFYMTYNKGAAADWARKVDKNSATVNKFAITLEKTSESLNVKRFRADEEWARFVYNNRYVENFKRPDYDIVIGPIADNGLAEVFSEVDEGRIDFKTAAARIKFHKFHDLQYAFCTERSLNLLKWMGRE